MLGKIGLGSLLLAVMLTLPVQAGTAGGRDDFFDRSLQRLAELPGFQCNFEQLMLYTDGGSQRYAGELAVLKPGQFRWQYSQPYEQLYVGDGRVIWHYEPDLLQAERLGNLESVDPVVMRLLEGRVEAGEIQILEQQQDGQTGIRRYRIQIGKDAPETWLGFLDSGELVFIEREDMLGNRNRVALAACSYVAPPANLFSFTPPEGVEVLDMRSNQTAE